MWNSREPNSLYKYCSYFSTLDSFTLGQNETSSKISSFLSPSSMSTVALVTRVSALTLSSLKLGEFSMTRSKFASLNLMHWFKLSTFRLLNSLRFFSETICASLRSIEPRMKSPFTLVHNLRSSSLNWFKLMPLKRPISLMFTQDSMRSTLSCFKFFRLRLACLPSNKSVSWLVSSSLFAFSAK